MPLNGIANPQLSDGPALALAIQSQNQKGFVSGLTATASGTQTTSLQLSQTAPLVEVDTVTSTGDGVKLPAAIPGAVVCIYNGGSNTLDVFPFASTDTINSGSAGAAFTIATHIAGIFFCAKSGSWGAR